MQLDLTPPAQTWLNLIQFGLGQRLTLGLNVLICRDVTVGDIVTVGECRPLSKTVRFNVLKVTKAAGAKKQFQKF